MECPIHEVRYRWTVDEYGTGRWKCPECDRCWGERIDGGGCES